MNWQAFEIENLLPNAKPKTQFVIPVLLPSFDDRQDRVAEFLSGLIYVDLRKPENKPLDQLIWAISGENPNLKRSVGAYYRRTSGLASPTLAPRRHARCHRSYLPLYGCTLHQRKRRAYAVAKNRRPS